MKLCYTSLLASLLLCMPPCHIQPAAELRPDNLHQILSGIVDLQDGTRRTLDQVQELVNDTIENTNFIQVLCAMPAKKRTQLLNDFNITLEEAPQDDDYSDEDNIGDDSGVESPGTKRRTPELPSVVLCTLLKEFGYINEEGEPLVGLCGLPQEVIGITLRNHFKLSLKTNPTLVLRVSITKNIIVDPHHTFLALKKRTQDHNYELYDFDGKRITLQKADETPIVPRLIKFSPQGRFFSVLDPDDVWYLFTRSLNLVTLTDQNQRPVACPHSANRNTIRDRLVPFMPFTFSPNDELIILKDGDSNQHLFNNQGSYVPLSLPDHTPLVCKNIDFSPKGNLLIASDETWNKHLFDLKGNPILLHDDAGQETLDFVLISPNENYILAKDNLGFLHLLDGQGNHLRSILGPEGEPFSCNTAKFSEDETVVILQDEAYNCHLYDIMGNYRALLPTPHTYEGEMLLDFIGSNCIRREEPVNSSIDALFDFHGNPVTLSFPDGSDVNISEIPWSQNQQHFLVRDNNGYCHLFDRDQNYLTTLKDGRGKNIKMGSLKDSPCQTNFIAVDKENHCHLFDSMGNWLATLRDQNDIYLKESQPRWSPDGRLIHANKHVFDMAGNLINICDSEGVHIEPSYVSLIPLCQIRFPNRGPIYVYTPGSCTIMQKHRELIGLTNFISINTLIPAWGMYPDQLFLLSLLVGLKKCWQVDYPKQTFATCPADITCALLVPHMEAFATMSTKERKRIVKQTHDWVTSTLETLKDVTQTIGESYYDKLCLLFNFQEDPIVTHPEYDENGFIAEAYLIPYVFLMSLI